MLFFQLGPCLAQNICVVSFEIRIWLMIGCRLGSIQKAYKTFKNHNNSIEKEYDTLTIDCRVYYLVLIG